MNDAARRDTWNDTLDPVELSVIVPMFREAGRIGDTLADLVPVLRQGIGGAVESAELILVDDGSDDGTGTRVGPWLKDDADGRLARVRLLRHAKNRGKGAAVRTGLLGAVGRWRLMMDADNSSPVTEAVKLLAEARRSGAGLVAGSRRAPGSVVTARRSRRLTGWLFQRALGLIGMRLIDDTQCGFKLYRADAAAYIGRTAREDGWAFDIEHLMLAQRAGLGIAEVGVVWSHRDGGTINSGRDGLVMLARALRMRLAAARMPRPAAMSEPKPVRAPAARPHVVVRAGRAPAKRGAGT